MERVGEAGVGMVSTRTELLCRGEDKRLEEWQESNGIGKGSREEMIEEKLMEVNKANGTEMRREICRSPKGCRRKLCTCKY